MFAILIVTVGDTIIAWRNSLFVGLLLTLWYGLAVYLGFRVGLALHDLIGPLVDALRLIGPRQISTSLKFASLTLSVIAAIAVCLYIARRILYAILLLFEDSDADDSFYTAASVALPLALIAISAAYFVGATSYFTARTIDVVTIVAFSLIIIAFWLHLRYRLKWLHRHWTGLARVYRHDLGAALVRLEKIR